MKKKAFTLVELLAVIVILAVIALIATPAVLNIIEDSKKSAAEASARNIANSAKAYYMSNLMNNISTGTIDLSNSSFKYDGEQAKKGVLSYDDDGNVVGKIYVSGYCIEINSDKLQSEKISEDECDIKLPPKVYKNGEVVYFNVTTGTKCTDYTESQSNTSVNSGCMKFYAFLDDGSDTVNLLLDHNTTPTLAWSYEDSTAKGPGDVLAALETDTSKWKGTKTPKNYTLDQSAETSKAKYTIDYTGYKARLITANEIARITGNTSWDETKSNVSFYFDSNTNTKSKTCGDGGLTGCKYGWLYDRTYKYCEYSGCLNNSVTPKNEYSMYGYWTATSVASSTNSIWYVFYDFGLLHTLETKLDYYAGVRPVIEVDKSLLN